jgi:hypothetical protein
VLSPVDSSPWDWDEFVLYSAKAVVAKLKSD